MISLALFNAVFAVNILDIAFLWSGEPLPAGVSLADHAHRGAYPLIVDDQINELNQQELGFQREHLSNQSALARWPRPTGNAR